jgi:hypothetical protein
MPTAFANASRSQLERLKTVAEYDLWFVAERLRDKHALPPDHIPIAIEKFKYFIMLHIMGERSLYVPCNEVDEVWHHFLLFTREYMTFCRRIGTGFIHHTPHTSRRPVMGRPCDQFRDGASEFLLVGRLETPRLYMCSSSGEYQETTVSCG